MTKLGINRGLLVIVLVLAAFLRLYRLDDIPPGVTHDEADTGYFMAAVYRGARSPVQAPSPADALYVQLPFQERSMPRQSANTPRLLPTNCR